MRAYCVHCSKSTGVFSGSSGLGVEADGGYERRMRIANMSPVTGQGGRTRGRQRRGDVRGVGRIRGAGRTSRGRCGWRWWRKMVEEQG